MKLVISPRLPHRLGLVLLLSIVAFGLLGPLQWPDYAGQELARFLEAPSLVEPLGRDQLGRSVIARLASATRLSLLLALLCVVTAAVLGSMLGLVAAWRGGWADAALRSVADGVLALPGLLIVLIFSALAQGGFWTLYLGLALAQWVEYFRMVRARSRQVLASSHVEAAYLLGFGHAYVVRRHVWPELRPMLATMMVFGIGTAILALSTLGFVGVGIQPPTPELGLMMTEAFPHYSEAPWMVLSPVVLLGLTLFGLVLVQGKEGHA